MSTPHGTDAAELRRLASKVREIDSDLDSVRAEVERVEYEHREDIAEVRRQLSDQGSEIEDVQGSVSTVENGLDSLAKQVAKIADRAGWLERHIRASGTARLVDFDSHPTSLHDVIAAVHHGHSLAARLMEQQTRRSLEFMVEQAATRETKVAQLTETALAANQVLISTAYEIPEHKVAAERFRAAYVDRKKLTVTHSEQAPAVDNARRKLAAANSFRDANRAEIAAGEAAGRTLRTRMRTVVVTGPRELNHGL